MIAIPFPKPEFKIKHEGSGQFIFDIIRKKYVLLTPEEWVRQNLINYLIKELLYPKGLISVEKEIKINNLRKRYDIVVYDYDHKPWMLIECKEPGVAVSDVTLQQLLRYHHVLQCPYWFLTNGASHFCAEVKNNTVKWLEAIPAHNS
jgi:hypothetical protein